MEVTRIRVFLSHNGADKPAVEELARILKAQGVEPWFDAWNLIPGTPWQAALTQALESCQACAVCIGPSGVGSWQTEEMNAAIQLQVTTQKGRVIPVLLPGAQRGERSSLPVFLTGRTWVEFHDSLHDTRALHRLLAGIRGEEPGPDPDETAAPGVCPYRGLAYFDVKDTLFYHGREILTGWLLAKLRPTLLGNRFLAIVGPSGSGKSSLARAGLLGSLQKGEIPGSQDWPLVICKPGPQPLESLAVELTRVLRPGDSPAAVNELIRGLGDAPRTLHLTTRLALGDAPKDRRVVVLIDQFEEVFSLCTDEAQRRALIANLLTAAREPGGCTAVVLTLRSDFFGRCAGYPELAAAISDRTELVGAMTEEELRKAVEVPARLAGLELEGGLADLLTGEVLGEVGGLPLLEHALLQLWQRRQGAELTVAAYREIGGVAGGLQRHAEEVFAQFTPAQQEACRRVLLRLVQVDDQRRVTKRRLELDELIPPNEPEAEREAEEVVVSRLANERLLTTEAGNDEKSPTDELAHEALLGSWKRLGGWIDADREALRIRRHLDDAVAEWLAKGRDPSYLYTGSRLTLAEEWTASKPGELSRSRQEFLKAGAFQRDSEMLRKKRQRRMVMAVLTVVAVASVVTAGAMNRLRKESQRQRDVNLGAQLAAQSTTALPLNPSLSLLLAATALRLGGDDLPEARGAVMSALARLPGASFKPILAATPDGAWIATGDHAGGTADVEGPFDANPRALQGVEPAAAAGWAFSPDHSRLVEATEAGEFLVWTLSPWDPVPRLRLPSGSVSLLALSPGGTFLAASGEAGAHVWDLRNPQPREVQPDSAHSGATAFAFDSEPSLLAVGFKSGATGVYFLRDLGLRDSPLPRDTGIEALAFSPDSRRLAVKDKAGNVEIVDLGNPRTKIALDSQDRGVKMLAFSQDGRLLAAGGRKGTGQLWSLAGDHASSVPVLWQEHTGEFRALSFTGEGKQLTTACAQGTVRHWPLDSVELIRVACGKAGRSLTSEQWSRYAPRGESFRKGMPCGGG